MAFELVPAGTKIDFIGKRRVCAALSLLILIAGAVAAVPSIRGVRLGIDFAGGTEVQVLFAEGTAVDEGAVRAVVAACGVEDPSVIRYGDLGEAEFLIGFRGEGGGEAAAGGAVDCPLTDDQRQHLAEVAEAAGGKDAIDDTGALVDSLALALGNTIGPVEIERVDFVGPRVGSELRRAGVKALAIACVLILIYIAFRFSMRFAPGAVVALVHDVGITAGLFVIMGLDFDLRVLAALLAILGYSLNDTIIIYDRIRENMELHTKHDLIEVLNLSVNQTLSRTVLTSGTTMVAVLSLLFLGGEVIRPFAIAMTIGIVVGTYSSVFIAAPTLLFLENRFGGEGLAGKLEKNAGRPRPERPVRRQPPESHPKRPTSDKRSKRRPPTKRSKRRKKR